MPPQAVKAVVLASGKPSSWIAGANIKRIEEIKTAGEASKLVSEGQQVMNRVSDMQKKKPWIAAIDGACLGGGLEMAMTCTQRIATSNSKTVSQRARQPSSHAFTMARAHHIACHTDFPAEPAARVLDTLSPRADDCCATLIPHRGARVCAFACVSRCWGCPR